MKTRRSRVALLLTLCLLLASLVTALIVSAEEEADGTGALTVVYANGVTETYAEGDVIAPIAVPTDFVKLDGAGDAYVFTVSEGAEWSFVFEGETIADLTVSAAMLGKTVYADVDGTLGSEKVYYTIREVIQDETVPEEMRGEFFIYGYDEASLIKYLSRENTGSGDAKEPRYRYLRQRDNEFYITMYEDMNPTKFDPRWGAATKDWALEYEGGTYMVQDRTWRGDKFDSTGVPAPTGTSAQVFFNLNGHTLEIGSSESFHFGSMACTPYSMRLYFYSTVPGAVFSGAKSEAVFYSDDDSAVYVGELASGETKYGQNLSVYGKMVAHVNYGGGVWLWGGRYYQVGVNHAFLNISHRLYEVKNCEFYLADQSEAVLFFNDGQKSNWSATNSGSLFENCTFYVKQYGTKLLREVASRTNAGVEKEPVSIDQKYNLSFVNCSFYGIPVVRTSNYLRLKYEGETTYSVGSPENFGTLAEPAYISYLANPTKTATLIDMNGIPFTVVAACEILPASEVACVEYQKNKTYWQPGAVPFVYDRVVVTLTERYVESDGSYEGLPEVLEAGKTYAAEGVVYKTKSVFAFIYVMKDGTEGYGLVGANAIETGLIFANKVGNLKDGTITLLSDIVISTNVDFGTKGDVFLDLNGYKLTVAEDAKPTGAVHRIGDAMNLTVYSSRSGAVYENLSAYPIFSLSHGGKGGSISIGDYEYKNGAIYDGQNVTYISNGSFFIGYPMTVVETVMFKASNCNFVYTGAGAAFIFANDGSIESSRITLAPLDKTAKPVAIATRSDAVATVGISGCALYAADGVQATAYVCLDMASGLPANAAVAEQRITFGNTALWNVTGSLSLVMENVEQTFSGHTSFAGIEALMAFYNGSFPASQNPVYTSAQFFIDGALKRVSLLTLAAPKDIAKVTFNSGKANLGTVIEDWLIGSIAYKENFVFADIFVYTYGTRVVSESSNILTAGCSNLANGTMRVNLSWTSGLKLNLWIPMESPITSVSVNGVETQILATLDYKGDYYLVQTLITPDMLAKKISIAVQTEKNSETLQLQLTSYISKLLADDSVSREEKLALYALVEIAEQMAGKSLGVQVPVGYLAQQAVADEEAIAPSGNISQIAFDLMANGAALTVKGTNGTAIALIAENGTRIEGMIKDGACRFENVPVYLLIGTLTVECGEDLYTYSVDLYKGSLTEINRTRADVLYTYIYYVNELYNAAIGA